MNYGKICKLILYLTIILVLMNCASCSHKELKLDKTPITESDFLLPPEKLIEQYPDVAGYHLPNLRSYTSNKSIFTSFPSLQQIEKLWGKPDFVEKSNNESYRFFTHPLFGISFEAIPIPLFSGIFFSMNLADYIIKEPLQRRVWHKGKYQIEIDENHPSRKVWSWDWYYKSNKLGIVPIIRYGRTGWYSITATSGVSNIDRTTRGSERFYALFGFGHVINGTRIFDNCYIDTLVSFQSFTKKNFFIIDLSQQLISMSVTWNLDQNSKEIGFGIWYDNSIVDAIDSGYQGKIGGFVEFTYYKSKNIQHGLRLGNAYDFGGYDDNVNYLKLQLLVRFHKIKSVTM